MMTNKELLEQIKSESETKLLKGNASEMTDIIFDTLFGNIQFPQFDIEKTTPIDEYDNCQVCDGRRGYIEFGYCGHKYKMQIQLVHSEYDVKCDNQTNSKMKIKEIAQSIVDVLKTCGFNDITDSSGYYIIKEFDNGTDRAVDVYKSDENGKPHYVIYCSYEDEDSDWKYTDNLSVEELKNILEELYAA